MFDADSYDEGFHLRHRAGAQLSASQIVPHLSRIAGIESVLDIGCGSGAWLQEFSKCGSKALQGIDGSIAERALCVPREWVLEANLQVPLSLNARYSWAVCLEVGEHLAAKSHRVLVESLCNHASLVAFSAAIPHQGGTDHIGERWPSYWASLFMEHKFQMFDAVRPYFWCHPDVEVWYKQNMFVYARGDSAELVNDFLIRNPAPTIVDVMHPDMYQRWQYRVRNGISESYENCHTEGAS